MEAAIGREGSFAASGHDVGVRRRSALGVPALAWGITATILLVVQRIGRLGEVDQPFLSGARNFVAGWRQFDGHQYIGIAIHGYWYDPEFPSTVVWFPLYPLLIRGLAPVTGDLQVAAYLVSLTGGLAAVLLCWRWLEAQGQRGTAGAVALAALFVSPYAFFLYGALYSDAVFLALVIGAFLCVERDRLVFAAILAALATATRPTGVCLVPALLLLALERSGTLSPRPGSRGLIGRFRVPVRLDRSRFRPGLAAPLAGGLGIGVYALYLGVRFGEPLAFLTNQDQFHPATDNWRHREFFHQLAAWADRGWVDARYPLTATFQALIVLGVLVSAPFVGRRYGWGYGLFTGLLAAVPLWGVGDFVGSGRYLLAAFPAYALLGERLATRSVARWVVLGCSGLVMAWLTSGFARGWYLT